VRKLFVFLSQSRSILCTPGKACVLWVRQALIAPALIPLNDHLNIILLQ